MPVDSLLEIVTRACGRISKRITDIGDIPYDLIRPVLLKVESPEQLHQIETNSPQIIGRDGELWLALIKRDIPDWENKPHQPSDPKNWWKVYRKLKKESQNDMALGEDKLKAALHSIQSEKEQNVAQMVTRKDLPRSGPSMRQRIVHGYTSGRTGSRGASKLSLMEKVKREARDARAARMAVPNCDPVKKVSSLVTRPPQQFVEDIKREQMQKAQMMQRQQSSADRPIRAPRPPMHAPRPKALEDLSYKEMQDRETRLRALTSGRTAPKTTTAPKVAGDGPSSPVSALSTSFLESPDPMWSTSPGAAIERPPRIRSPARIGSPQPRLLKRKEPPSVFMSFPTKAARQL